MKAKATPTPKRRWVRVAVVGVVVALGLATSAGAASAFEASQTTKVGQQQGLSGGIRW